MTTLDIIDGIKPRLIVYDSVNDYKAYSRLPGDMGET